jgi:uncharacterized damage-inducible protein DinB
MTDLRTSLLQQLAATHDGDPWYGPSRSGLLSGLTPDQALAHSVAGGHSIWELVLHMTAWTNEVRRRLGGQPAAEPVEGDWPAVGPVSAESWDRARAALAEAHAELLAAARALPPSRWDEPVGDTREPALGTGVTMGGMLIGFAQHDAYHTGQVAQMRRAVLQSR